MPSLDKNSPIPLYYQLKLELAKMIEKEYKPGDCIPTETELKEMFGVSRVTVRQAVAALVQDDILCKKQGRGTYVQAPRITHYLSGVTSWTNQIRQMGLQPKTVSQKLERIFPSEKLQQLMNIGPQEPVLQISRVRYAGEEPMCIMVNYLLEKKVPNLLEKNPDFESLYQLLREDYGIVIKKAQETVQARKASPEEAKVLKIDSGDSLLFVTRISELESHEIFEVVNVTSRADRFQYIVMLSEV